MSRATPVEDEAGPALENTSSSGSPVEDAYHLDHTGIIRVPERLYEEDPEGPTYLCQESLSRLGLQVSKEYTKHRIQYWIKSIEYVEDPYALDEAARVSYDTPELEDQEELDEWINDKDANAYAHIPTEFEVHIPRD